MVEYALPFRLLAGTPRSSRDAVHDSVMRLAMNHEAVVENALSDGPRPFGHALAPLVPKSAHDFQAHKIGAPKRPVGSPDDRHRSHTAPGGGRPNPVTEIAEPVDRGDLVDTASAKERARRVQDGGGVYQHGPGGGYASQQFHRNAPSVPPYETKLKVRTAASPMTCPFALS